MEVKELTDVGITSVIISTESLAKLQNNLVRTIEIKHEEKLKSLFLSLCDCINRKTKDIIIDHISSHDYQLYIKICEIVGISNPDACISELMDKARNHREVRL